MAELQMIQVPGGPPPGGHYSQAIAVGDFVFSAGQVAVDGDGRLVGTTAAEQTIATLRNVERVLKAAGTSLDRVVKTTCFLVEMADFPEFNRAYVEVFGEHRPARSTVGVAALAMGALVEIECVALR
jgi:2-iminobutanoate/2-iminopropanoate deaminase